MAPTAPHLKTYTDDLDAPRYRRAFGFIVAGVLLLTLFQGLLFGLFAPALGPMFVVVPAILLALVIWALPDIQNPPTRLMEGFFLAYFVVTYMWPNYLALALPGLPWITLIRLTDFPMVFLLAVCLSQSRPFRQEMGTILSAAPLIWKPMLVVVVIMMVTLPFSKVISESIGKAILVFTNWITVYLVSLYYFRKKGRVEPWVLLLCAMMFVLGLMAIVESRERHILWAYSIPSFLKVEDPSVIALLRGARRMYTDIYRAQTTFSGPLGLGEFIAIVFPFVLHFVATEYRLWARLTAAAGVLFLVFVAFLSGSRSAVLGALISAMMTLGVWGFMRWRRRGSHLLGAAVVFSYPIIGVMVLASTFLIGRIRIKVWGGGETVSSTQARVDQWNQGIPLILHNPFGHGIGTAAEVLQYRLPGGLLVIDSYFLRILLDWGVMGFLVFFGMMFAAASYGVRLMWRDDFKDPETIYAIPVAISLLSWVVVKGVNAEEGNHPFVFMLLGMMTALVYRASKAARS